MGGAYVTYPHTSRVRWRLLEELNSMQTNAEAHHSFLTAQIVYEKPKIKISTVIVFFFYVATIAVSRLTKKSADLPLAEIETVADDDFSFHFFVKKFTTEIIFFLLCVGLFFM